MSEGNDLRVSGSTDPKRLADAIVIRVEEEFRAKIVAVGANAVSQAVKGLIIARSKAVSNGDLFFKAHFDEFEGHDGDYKTSIVFIVERER